MELPNEGGARGHPISGLPGLGFSPEATGDGGRLCSRGGRRRRAFLVNEAQRERLPEPCSAERKRRHRDDEAVGGPVGGWMRRRRRCSGGTGGAVTRWGGARKNGRWRGRL
jgi:hypothetical protein